MKWLFFQSVLEKHSQGLPPVSTNFTWKDWSVLAILAFRTYESEGQPPIHSLFISFNSEQDSYAHLSLSKDIYVFKQNGVIEKCYFL